MDFQSRKISRFRVNWCNAGPESGAGVNQIANARQPREKIQWIRLRQPLARIGCSHDRRRLNNRATTNHHLLHKWMRKLRKASNMTPCNHQQNGCQKYQRGEEYVSELFGKVRRPA